MIVNIREEEGGTTAFHVAGGCSCRRGWWGWLKIVEGDKVGGPECIEQLQ